jgi:nucleoside 2-deoxyribosyltransferase
MSAIDAESELAAKTVAKNFNLNAEFIRRDEPVEFSYFTPISSPAVAGRNARIAAPIKVHAENVLIFGMVERGEYAVDAESLVFDPQRPREMTVLELTGLKHKRLAIVLNRSEAAAVTKGKAPEQAAREIARRYKAEAVIVKSAALGATVFANGKTTTVAPLWTPKVYPIGSGDVFAAGFAWAWAEKGLDPHRAAKVGSLAAATWCSTESLPLPRNVAGLKTNLKPVRGTQSNVYLAGPLFTLADEWLIDLCRSAILGSGARCISPLHDVGRGGVEVAAEDIKGLNRCTSVLALMDTSDPGTWFELGWARDRGKPVVGYCNPDRPQDTKMPKGMKVEIVHDIATAVYHAIWAGQG